jgi:hypothetical protein
VELESPSCCLRSAGAAGECSESGFGDEGVDDVADSGEVVGAEFGEVGELVAEGVFGAVEGSAGDVVYE